MTPENLIEKMNEARKNVPPMPDWDADKHINNIVKSMLRVVLQAIKDGGVIGVGYSHIKNDYSVQTTIRLELKPEFEKFMEEKWEKK